MGGRVERPSALRGHGTLCDDIGKFSRLSDVFALHLVVADHVTPLPGPDVGGQPGEIGVFETGEILPGGFQGYGHLPPGFRLPRAQLPYIVGIAVGHLGRVLEDGLDVPAVSRGEEESEIDAIRG